MAGKKTTVKAKAVKAKPGKGVKPAGSLPEGVKMASIKMDAEMLADAEVIAAQIQSQGFESTRTIIIRLALRQLRIRLEAGEKLTVAKEG